jgi:asparagine synthase (glutamine-hydrolysing)
MEFFLVLPDCAAADRLTQRIGVEPGTRVIRYPSGRPWLVGRWSDEEMAVVAGARGRRLVVWGNRRPDLDGAARALDRAGTLADLDGFAGSLAGSVHLCATIDGRTRAQGSVCTARQILSATVAGVTVAASQPHPLVALTGAGVDEDALALRLLAPGVPWPLSQRPVWSGLAELPAGCWLELDPDGGSRTVRWWHAPAAETPLAQARDTLRDALAEAVAVRARGRGTISSDLSGGLDSTSLAFLAAGTGAQLVTSHWRPLDQANDDWDWAQRAAVDLPDAIHQVVAAEDGPTWFEADPNGDGPEAGAEGPLLWSRNRARMEHITRAVAELGSTLHLCGVGGDELFSPIPAYLWSLTRRHPVRNIGRVRRWRALNRWRLAPLLRGLADGGTFAASLGRDADLVTAPPLLPSEVHLGWSAQPRMPPWASRAAVDAVRRQLRAASATQPRPLHPDRAQHLVLESAVHSGAAVRQLNALLSRFGVRWEIPYLDDRVVEAALSVRIEDRIAPGRYKPVLTAALRDLVPEPILGRRSKGEYSAEVYAGLQRNQRHLLALCDDLRLAELGLVDAAALRAALIGPKPEARHLTPFENTLACEAWLRTPRVSASRDALLSGDPR